jgi:hypothetical protein
VQFHPVVFRIKHSVVNHVYVLAILPDAACIDEGEAIYLPPELVMGLANKKVFIYAHFCVGINVPAFDGMHKAEVAKRIVFPVIPDQVHAVKIPDAQAEKQTGQRVAAHIFPLQKADFMVAHETDAIVKAVHELNAFVTPGAVVDIVAEADILVSFTGMAKHGFEGGQVAVYIAKNYYPHAATW